MMKKVLGFIGMAAWCGAAFAEPISAAMAAVTSVLGTAGTAAAAGVLGSVAASKLFGGKTAATQQAAKPMPVADDKAVEDARRRQIAAIQARSGRASTVLSDGAKLGG